MPSKLTLTLDAAQYQQQLEAVVQQTRQAAEQMAALSGDRKITVTAETSQAELVLSDLPQAEDQQISVAADTSPAETILADLSDQSESSEITVPVSADTSPAEAAINNIPAPEPVQIPVADDAIVQATVQAARLRDQIAQLEQDEIDTQIHIVDEDIARLQNRLSDLESTPVNVRTQAQTEEIDRLRSVIATLEDRKITIRAHVESDELNRLREQLQQVETQSGSTGTRFGRLRNTLNMRDFAGQFKSGAAAISAIGSAAGASVPAVGMLGTVINAVLSPISLIATAFTALVTVGTKVWDMLTVSVAEYAAKSKLASEEADREISKMKEQEAAAAGYISRLKELSSAEMTGNAAKTETAQLLETLQNRYGDLGAEIDAATGKIKNMTEVEERLNAVRRKRAAQKYLASADASMNEARAAYMKAAGQGYFGERRAGRKFEQAQKSMTPDQLLKYMENRAKNAKTEADIRNYSEVASHLRKAAEAREKAQSVLGTGQESGLAAEQEASKKAAGATAAKKARDDAARQFAERKSDDEFAQEKDIDKKKANRQARIDAEKKNETQYQKELDAARDTLAKIQKDKGKPGYDAGAEADAAKAVADAERKVQESQAKQYGFKQQIQQLDKQRNEEAKKMVDQSKFELEYNRLIAAGEYDKAAALKLEHELKQRNLKLTEAEKKAILDQQKAQKALALQKSNRDKAQDLKWRAMEKAGRGKEASEQRALWDAERTKGSKLTPGEIATTKKLHELTWQFDNRRGPDFGDLSIKTNDLTRRGGFQGGAVVPDKDKYNQQIASENKAMHAILQRIESMVAEFGKF